MALFILPTSGPRNYRGKYPLRVRSVSYSRDSGLHVELNNGTRLWTMQPAALPHILAPELPRPGIGFHVCMGQAVPMTVDQYETLRNAAVLLRTRADIAGHGRRAELETRVRAMLESIVPADPEAEAAERAESCLIFETITNLDAADPAPVRRDNVEYYEGRKAYAAGADAAAMPYSEGGERAARWSLGYAEAKADAESLGKAAPVPAGVIDMTPTWAGMLPTLRMLVENGSAEGRRIAWEELGKAAALADERNRLATRIAAASQIVRDARGGFDEASNGRALMDSLIAALAFDPIESGETISGKESGK